MGKLAASALGIAWIGFAASLGQAAGIDFDTDADYDSNFHEVANGNVISRNAAGYLQQTNASDIASAMIYNTHATGGSGGSGGTGSGLPLDTFGGTSTSGGFTIQADASVSAYDNASSLGFYVKANDARTNAYAGVFRIQARSTGRSR